MTPQEEFDREWKKLCEDCYTGEGGYKHHTFTHEFIRSKNMACDDNYDRYLASEFDAHGIKKGSLDDQKRSLLSFCKNGISDETYTAPFCFKPEDATALGSAFGVANGAYKTGLAVVVSGYQETLEDNGVKLVLLTDLAESLLPSLRKMFPNIMFEKLSQAQNAFKYLYKKATGKQWNKTSSPIQTTHTDSTSKFKYTPIHTNKAGYRQREYLDSQGNEIFHEIDYGKSVARVYQNGLRVDFYYDSPQKEKIIQRGYSCKDQNGKISVITLMDGKVSSKGDTTLLTSKINELSQKKFLQLPSEIKQALTNPQNPHHLKGFLMRHSMSNAQTAAHQAGKVQGS